MENAHRTELVTKPVESGSEAAIDRLTYAGEEAEIAAYAAEEDEVAEEQAETAVTQVGVDAEVAGAYEQAA